jgi:hypothetical protein
MKVLSTRIQLFLKFESKGIRGENIITEPILTSLFRPLNDYTSLPAAGQGSSVDDPEAS